MCVLQSLPDDLPRNGLGPAEVSSWEENGRHVGRTERDGQTSPAMQAPFVKTAGRSVARAR